MQGKAHPGQVSIAMDEIIPGFQKLTNCVHGEGGRIIAQISHAGTASMSKFTGQAPVGPSTVYHPKQKEELPEGMMNMAYSL